jgi:spore germination cell wall hydrolase CwlJ-like protein
MAEQLIPAWMLAVATLMGEAGIEPYEGKVAVARVIRNRMRLRYSSDGTVEGTVFSPYQFSLWNTGERGRIKAVRLPLDNPRVQEAIRAWEHSRIPARDFDHAVLYHATPKIMAQLGLKIPSWAKKEARIKQIHNHIFYTDLGWQERIARDREKQNVTVAD